jgi:hypothetical protein
MINVSKTSLFKISAGLSFIAEQTANPLPMTASFSDPDLKNDPAEVVASLILKKPT